MNPGIELASAFMRGELHPFAKPVEDSKPFIALAETYSERSASIESALMELAHGSCHTLTIALAEALGTDDILLISDAAGMPVHSGLHNSELGLIFDANGTHGIDASLSFWSRLAGSKCTATQLDVDDLYALSGCDEDDIAMALEDFDLVAEFIRVAILGQADQHPLAI